MMNKRTLLLIVLFPNVYNVFTAICSVIGRINDEYKDTVFFIWYHTTLVVWFAAALLWISLIIKLIKFKQDVMKRKE